MPGLLCGDERDGWAFLEGDNQTVLENIEKVIRRYQSIGGVVSGDILGQVYNMREAAEYLGITYDGMKLHVSRAKHLRGKQKGKDMLFTRQQLDAFKKEHIRGVVIEDDD